MSQGNAIDLNIFFGGAQDIVAAHIVNFWTMWNANRNLALDRWNEVYKYIYATSTRDTTNESVTNWSNTTHRPKMANLFDTLTINYDAALFPNDDWLIWRGADKQSVNVEKRQAIEAYMKTKHRLRSSGFRDAMRRILTDWVWTGNAFAQVDYVVEQQENPDTGDITTSYVGPKVSRLNPRDIVFNPTGTEFKRSPKLIRKLFTVGELERIVQERPDQQHFRDILDVAKKNRSHIRQFNQGDLLQDNELGFDGYGSTMEYFQSGLVEVIEFYGDMFIPESDSFMKNHVITVVDRWHKVRDEAVTTWTGAPHIYHVGWRERPGNLWAMGPLDNLVGLQYRMDHLENARADAFDQMIDPDLVFAGDVEDIMQVGGAKHYYIAENGAINNLQPDTTVLNADFQIQELEEKMELYALAPREALGVRSPGEKTAFEVNQLSTAASRAFEHKVLKFQEFLEEIVNAELEVAVRNLDQTDIIETTDDELGAQKFRTITRRDIEANGRLVPVGARHFGRDAQLTQELVALQQGPLADPEVAQHFSSIGLANIYQELLQISGTSTEKIVQPYIRIDERLEAQRRLQVAEDTADRESLTSVVPPEEDIDGAEQAGI
jgi:hypothetical protein